jgi:hypothetical protein
MFFNLINLYLLTNINAENFCVNCVHFRKNIFSFTEFGRCGVFPREPSNKADYLVSGKPGIEFMYCSTVRMNENMCGLKGKYFQKKCNTFENFCIKNKNSIE